MRILFFFFLFVSVNSLSAQNKDGIDKITKRYNQKNIKEIIREIVDYEVQKEAKVTEFLKENQDYERTIKSGFKISVLDNVIDGNAIYIETGSEKSAKGTRTNFLQPNGDLNLDLEGEGMTIALWEVGGKSLISHVEFQNNGSSRIIPSDSGNDITYHSTHVSGTIISAGINSEARGMASKAILKSYNQSEDSSEAAIEAANGLLISNHSYGIPVIGSNGPVSTWIMGSYDTSARNWDVIANNCPYYLSVFSAGNSGEETNSEGLAIGYDKLTGEQNSKNNLVVANASNASINNSGEVVFGLIAINDSSSQGPSDDGRIKPDITGLGTDILSTSDNVNNNTYSEATGTSMSAPNVSGTLLLLQELYYREYNEYMLSSSLKALVLNTASDGGNEGPDAIFGWGLLNAKKAANVILRKISSESILEEETLMTGQTKVFQITAKGGEPVSVMIVWNDPAGEARNGELNNSTPALINDLDLRISNATQSFFPWKLDLNDVSAPAIKGDNSVDNIEQILIDDPIAGENYTIKISHKGNLEENQDFSIVATGISATTLNLTDFNPQSISFWPNPVNNNLNITTIDFEFKNDVSVSIYDIMGREILSINDFDYARALNIDVSSLSKGVYIVNLTDGQQTINRRIIKE
jgi:hypothetical protein